MHPNIEQFLATSRQHASNGNTAGAFQAAEQALAAARAQADVEAVAHALTYMANLHLQLGHYAQADDLAAQSLAVVERSISGVRAWVIRGTCAAYCNDLSRAEEVFHRASDLSRQIGFLEGHANALHNLAACVYSLRGQFDLALTTSAESHRICVELAYPDWGYPMIQAEIYRMIGDRQQARTALAQLKQVSQPGSLYRGVYCCYQARLALDEDDMAQARQWLVESRTIAEAIGNPILDVWIRVEQSRSARLQGDIPAAQAWAEDALRFATRSGFAYLEVLAQVEVAQCFWAAGDLATAKTNLDIAFATAVSQDLRYEQARATFFLAALAYQQEMPNAESLWIDAAARIVRGGYAFLLERERALAFPTVAAFLHSRTAQARAAAEMLLNRLTQVAALPLHIYGLGRFQVYQGRRAIPDRHWQQRKAGELFRFLLLQPRHSANREVVIDTLWPEQGESAARTASQSIFHQATSALRRILEPDLPGKFPSRYLLVEADQVTLSLPPGSTIDFERFEAQLTASLAARLGEDGAASNEEIEGLEEILALYVDDLFPPDRYVDWAIAPRERLAALYLRGLLLLARLYQQMGFPHKALAICHHILGREAWSEDAVLIGMQAHHALNDRPAALRLYNTLESTLRRELDLAPRSDLQALVQLLRQA